MPALQEVVPGAGDEAATRTLLHTDPALDLVPLDSGTTERIGSYRVVKTLGRGGMGEVLLAVRDDEQYRKRVAIKIMRRGLESEDLLRRFRHERQILAAIAHPNIAQLLDGGALPDGRPYYVMEYIEGQPLDAYCDSRRLSIGARLEIFLAVCSAVQFAHRNLVVHRDIKPANILVTADGTPKLVDFGIAKLLQPELYSATLHPTGLEERLMTPEYASPEQIRGEPITTATDVYGLGVVLFELLTGQRPFSFDRANLHEIARAICEETPPRPSALVARQAVTTRPAEAEASLPTKLSRAREENPRSLHHRLAGDLDAIVLMALRKEPERRYGSVDQLAEDVRRYLEGRPIAARRGTLTYQFGKFVSRHRASVAASVLFLLSLIGFAGLMAVESARTARERDRAQHETEKAQAIQGFLRDLLGSANPVEGLGREVTVLEALRKAEGEIAGAFGAQPETEAAVRHTIGFVYLRLGRNEEAERLLESAYQLRLRILGGQHVDTAESLHALGGLAHIKGDLDDAERFFREALSIRRRQLGDAQPEVAETLNALAKVLLLKADYGSAEELFREALELRRRSLGESHPALAETLNDLARLAEEQGRFEEAGEFSRRALELQRRALGEESLAVAETLAQLGWLEKERGNRQAAEELLRESLRISRKRLGEEHPDVAAAVNDLALALGEGGDLAGAERQHREALALFRKALGGRHSQVATSLQNLADVVAEQGRSQEAERLYREALAMRRQVLGKDHPDVATAMVKLGSLICRKKDDRASAVPVYLEATAIFERALGLDHWRLANARSAFGSCLLELGKFEEAEKQLLAAQARFGDPQPEFRDRARRNLEHLVKLYEAWGRPEEARRYRELSKR